MKVTITLICEHPDGYSNHETITGRQVVVTDRWVSLDGQEVVWRDRRAVRNREAGHPWVSSKRGPEWDDKPRHERPFEAWTRFSIHIDSTRS